MSKYRIGNDGYYVIEIVKSLDNEWYKSKKLENAIKQRSLTSENISQFDLTELSRGACYDNYLKKCLKEFLGYNPLPITSYIDSDVNKPISLHPWQIEAIKFMKEREEYGSHYGIRGGIIKMEMGMGKSLLTVAHSLLTPRVPTKIDHGENGFPTLIIAPKTLMFEWKTECFEQFFGDRIKVLYLHKDFIPKKEFDSISRKELVKYDFVVTTYDVCGSICKSRRFYEDIQVKTWNGKVLELKSRTLEQVNRSYVTGPAILYTTPWERIIFDESQKFINPNSKIFLYMMSIYGKSMFCISGTPIKNKNTDIWSQFRVCGYNEIKNGSEWSRKCASKMKEHCLFDTIVNMTYKSAGIILPPKFEHNIIVNLDGNELDCYNRLGTYTSRMYDEFRMNICEYTHVLALFTNLRQCCIAPHLLLKGKHTEIVKKLYKSDLGEWMSNEYGTAGIKSAKITAIINVLKKIPQGEKTLIFSSFTTCLDLIAKACRKRIPSFNFRMLDGRTKGSDRKKHIHDFKTDESIHGFFISYKVGSQGLNLTAATNVIFVEPWWTQTVPDQAKARCWRIGQTKNVNIYNIFVADSVEDRIIQVCKLKTKMTQQILNESGKIANIPKLESKTLGCILRDFK